MTLPFPRALFHSFLSNMMIQVAGKCLTLPCVHTEIFFFLIISDLSLTELLSFFNVFF